MSNFDEIGQIPWPIIHRPDSKRTKCNGLADLARSMGMIANVPLRHWDHAWVLCSQWCQWLCETLWTAAKRPYLDPSCMLFRFIHEVSPKREGHCVMVRNVDWLWWLCSSFDSVYIVTDSLLVRCWMRLACLSRTRPVPVWCSYSGSLWDWGTTPTSGSGEYNILVSNDSQCRRAWNSAYSCQRAVETRQNGQIDTWHWVVPSEGRAPRRDPRFWPRAKWQEPPSWLYSRP